MPPMLWSRGLRRGGAGVARSYLRMQAAERPAQYREAASLRTLLGLYPTGANSCPMTSTPCHDTYGRPGGTLVKEILRTVFSLSLEVPCE
jgi:hypothetical protein